MNLNSPFATSVLRGLYAGLIVGGIAFLTTYQVAGGFADSAVVGGITFLTTLGARTGVEGIYDQRREDKTPPAP